MLREQLTAADDLQAPSQCSRRRRPGRSGSDQHADAVAAEERRVRVESTVRSVRGDTGTGHPGGRGRGPRLWWRPQNGGSSLNWSPCDAPDLDLLARSTLAVAHLRLGPTSSASISVTDRLSPSGVSQLRALSWPTTITRAPLPSDSALAPSTDREGCESGLSRPRRVVMACRSVEWAGGVLWW